MAPPPHPQYKKSKWESLYVHDFVSWSLRALEAAVYWWRHCRERSKTRNYTWFQPLGCTLRNCLYCSRKIQKTQSSRISSREQTCLFAKTTRLRQANTSNHRRRSDTPDDKGKVQLREGMKEPVDLQQRKSSSSTRQSPRDCLCIVCIGYSTANLA